MKYSDRKNRQRLYLYTHISYISYKYPIDLHITLVVPSRQCLFTYFILELYLFWVQNWWTLNSWTEHTSFQQLLTAVWNIHGIFNGGKCACARSSSSGRTFHKFCLLTFYTSSSWAQKLYTECGKSRRSFLCGVRVCDIDHWTIKLTGTSVCEYSNMAPFWMSLVLDARPYWTVLNLVAWVELFLSALVSFVAWVLHPSQSWRLKVPLPSCLVPFACHSLSPCMHTCWFSCVFGSLPNLFVWAVPPTRRPTHQQMVLSQTLSLPRLRIYRA